MMRYGDKGKSGGYHGDMQRCEVACAGQYQDAIGHSLGTIGTKPGEARLKGRARTREGSLPSTDGFST
jgi:hypothetical protein